MSIIGNPQKKNESRAKVRYYNQTNKKGEVIDENRAWISKHNL